MLCSRARIDGYRSPHEAAGVPIDSTLVRFGTFYVNGGYQQGLELLSRSNRPTAIFAGSDMRALGVLRAARELNLHVPNDLSVVGYDNISLTAWIGPALTTVNQPLHAMARTVTSMLFGLARGEEPTSRQIDLATDLIVRESAGLPATL